MSFNYAGFVTRLTANMAGYTVTNPASATPTTDDDFNNFLPEIIDYAEQRIYRELDFLGTRTRDTSQVTISGVRRVAIPGQFVVVESVALFVPAGNSPPRTGVSRVPLIRSTTDAIDAMWPDESAVMAPVFGVTLYSIFNEQVTGAASTGEIRIGPTPDNAYTVEFRGTYRPAPLSATNTNTFLATYLPDLFFTCAMIHASDYMRNFGAGDTPGMSTEWEAQYGKLKLSAEVEEARKKAGQIMTPDSPTARAAPQQMMPSGQ